MKSLPFLLFLAAGVTLQAQPALTIYNQNFAVVRDTIPLDLKTGVNDVTYADMTSQLEPDSVILRDLSGQTQLRILEQSYRNDPVSQELLLSLFEGKTIDFFVKQPNKPDETVSGKIIRSGFKSNTQPVIEVNGKVQFGLPGQPIFPSLGSDTVLNPTLTWKLESSAAAKFDAELAYVTEGLTWQASYNIVSPEKGDTLDLTGWITFTNNSGKTFNDAKIKVMAGNVNKIQAPQPERMIMAKAMMADSASAPAVTEKAFDEFHLYSIARPTTLRDQETKQVEFIRASGIESQRIYVYDGAFLDGWQPGTALGGGDPGYDNQPNKKVAVYREFKNSEKNHLGMPLPAGRVRFYTQDADGQMEFTGENTIDHTPKDETVRLYTGDSFDLVGERKHLNFSVNESEHRADESFAITVRNHKKEAAEIRVVEHLFRWLNWKLTDKSQDFTKTDAQTIEFRVPLKPDEEKTVTYTVHYTW
ncbi:MAG: hypothetical protein QM796_09650 [Chthoniobacteraceae bacterium]